MVAMQLYDEYPELSTEDQIYSIVIQKKCDRGQAYVTFSDSSKYWLAHSRNYQYSPFFLCEFIELGDSLIKKSHNDSILIYREGKAYCFLIGEVLNKED
jgi:hypothetical protein